MPGTTLKVKVVPSSSRDCIAGWIGEQLKIRVTAAPEKGRANQAVIALLSERLAIDRKAIRIIRGQASANKILDINGMCDAELRAALNAGPEAS